MKRAGALAAVLIAVLAPAACGGSDEDGGSTVSEPAPRAIVPSHQRSDLLPNEGQKAAAPDVPLAKGGDNSIQTFGAEARRDDRLQATRAAQAYLSARAVGNWNEACARMGKPARRQFGKLVKGGDCVDAMEALSYGVQKAKLRIAADLRVLSLRVQGNRGFLIYLNGEGTPSAIAVHRERGGWRPAALDGSALVL